jgi:hypothetical protein
MLPEFVAVGETSESERGEVLARITFPRAAAPTANDAMDELFDAFPDHEPLLLGECDDEWRFGLRWKSYPPTFVDPSVHEAAAALFEMSSLELGAYHEVHRWGGRDVVISMVHAWALLAPAFAMQRRVREPLRWVVHVDDHTDLMAPMVRPSAKRGFLGDGVFGGEINLADPESVVAAVRRGIVNKGNFLSAYLLAHSECRTVHLGANLSEIEFPLVPDEEVFVLGGTDFSRTGFLLVPREISTSGRFRQTPMFPHQLPMSTNDGLWLDVDLDYFCNRYNGDSDRRSWVARPNEHAEVMKGVDGFLTDLSAAAWVSQIEAVSIAVSPGFFPSDHWGGVIPAIREGIQGILEG